MEKSERGAEFRQFAEYAKNKLEELFQEKLMTDIHRKAVESLGLQAEETVKVKKLDQDDLEDDKVESEEICVKCGKEKKNGKCPGKELEKRAQAAQKALEEEDDEKEEAEDEEEDKDEDKSEEPKESDDADEDEKDPRAVKESKDEEEDDSEESEEEDDESKDEDKEDDSEDESDESGDDSEEEEEDKKEDDEDKVETEEIEVEPVFLMSEDEELTEENTAIVIEESEVSEELLEAHDLGPNEKYAYLNGHQVIVDKNSGVVQHGQFKGKRVNLVKARHKFLKNTYKVNDEISDQIKAGKSISIGQDLQGHSDKVRNKKQIQVNRAVKRGEMTPKEGRKEMKKFDADEDRKRRIKTKMILRKSYKGLEQGKRDAFKKDLEWREKFINRN